MASSCSPGARCPTPRALTRTNTRSARNRTSPTTSCTTRARSRERRRDCRKASRLVQWYWRVRTADRAGNLSAWSSTSTFTLGAAGGKKSVTSVGILPASVVGGDSANGLVYISGPAPAGGVVVHLSVHHSTAYTVCKSRRSPLPITVPATVTVPAGATQVAFTATTGPVTQSAPGAILATVDGVGQFGFLSVEPPGTTGTIRLDFTPMTVAGGKEATGTVTLGAPAPAGGQLVTIASQPSAHRARERHQRHRARGRHHGNVPRHHIARRRRGRRQLCGGLEPGDAGPTIVRVRPSLPRLLCLSFSPSHRARRPERHRHADRQRRR